MSYDKGTIKRIVDTHIAKEEVIAKKEKRELIMILRFYAWFRNGSYICGMIYSTGAPILVWNDLQIENAAKTVNIGRKKQNMVYHW